MPQYSDDQIPSARRDRRKDLKIYRNKKQYEFNLIQYLRITEMYCSL